MENRRPEASSASQVVLPDQYTISPRKPNILHRLLHRGERYPADPDKFKAFVDDLNRLEAVEISDTDTRIFPYRLVATVISNDKTRFSAPGYDEVEETNYTVKLSARYTLNKGDEEIPDISFDIPLESTKGQHNSDNDFAALKTADLLAKQLKGRVTSGAFNPDVPPQIIYPSDSDAVKRYATSSVQPLLPLMP